MQRTQGYKAANGLLQVQVQRADPWFRDGISETQSPDPKRHKSSLLAGWLAGGSGSILNSSQAVSSAESLWPLAGVGQEDGGCSGCSDCSPRLPCVLSSGVQANPLTAAGPGEAWSLISH